MPVMNIVVGSLFLEHDIGVTFVELSMELSLLLDRLELLNPVDLNRVFTSLFEESLSLRLHLSDILFGFFSVETVVFIVSFNHRDVILFVCFL